MTPPEYEAALKQIYLLGSVSGSAPCSSERDANTVIAELCERDRRPKVGVGAIVFKQANEEPAQILLEKRANPKRDGCGEWSCPGGWMEYGETFEQAALRELAEEASLKSTEARFLTAVTTVFPSGLHCVTAFVVVTGWKAMNGKGPAIPDSESKKIAALEWFKLTELPTPLFEPVRKLMLKPVPAFSWHEIYGKARNLLA